MKSAADYLAHIRALIIGHSKVLHWSVMREEVPTHPHHVHDGGEAKVLPHEPITAEQVLAIITTEAANQG